MFYDLIITGTVFLHPQSGMWFYCGQPLPMSRINWQILLREQSKQNLQKLPSSVSVHKNLAGIPVQSCYLSPGEWVHVCAHACMWLFMRVFSQKARGSWNRLHGATHIGTLLPTKASSGTAALPFASIFLIADQARQAKRPALFFPQSKLSPPVQWSKYKPPGWKQQCRLFAAPTAIVSLQSISTHQRNLQPSYEGP